MIIPLQCPEHEVRTPDAARSIANFGRKRGTSVIGLPVLIKSEIRARASRGMGRIPDSGHWSMIPKSGNRFSEKIMLKQEARAG
jgi:hypothetical protein